MGHQAVHNCGVTDRPMARQWNGARGFVAAMLAASVVATAESPIRRAANLTASCVERFEPAVDYFPDKAVIEDAANFRVEYRNSYKLVTVNDANPSGPAERYVLVQCGTPTPTLAGELAGARVVTIPIASLFVMSPTHLSSLADLNRMDVLTGVAQFDVVTDSRAEARIKAGRVVEFARAGLLIDVERVVSQRPSLLMGVDSLNPTLSVIRAAGVPVVANTEWRESSALGRSEWLKYVSLFLNEEGQAQTLYAALSNRYRTLSRLALSLPEALRPLVMTGRSTRGLFTIAGGRSYVASLIKDAGGRYAWAGNTAVASTTVDLEAEIHRASNADVWINGGGWKNLADMLDDEPRYAEFKAYRQGQVWVYERRQTRTGGNDYWSRSVTHPDLLLADLVKIFHPDLSPAHAFEWYMPVSAR